VGAQDAGQSWRGTVDLATALGAAARAAVLVQVDSAAWTEVAASALPGAPRAFQRYSFLISPKTAAPACSWRRSRGSPAAYGSSTTTATPARSTTARFSAGNGFAHRRRPGCLLQRRARHATLRFQAGWTQEQRWRAGRRPPRRLSISTTRGSRSAMRRPTTASPPGTRSRTCASKPGGQLAQGSRQGRPVARGHPRERLRGRGVVLHQRRILLRGVRLQLRRRLSIRYRIAAAEVQWAGNVGGSFDRACAHQDGLADPVPVDSGRCSAPACSSNADVYVPGLTDGTRERPELVLAQAELSRDGAPAHEWMRYVGRFGNDYRYRWEPDRRALSTTPWTSWKFAPRFSTDAPAGRRLPPAQRCCTGRAGSGNRGVAREQQARGRVITCNFT